MHLVELVPPLFKLGGIDSCELLLLVLLHFLSYLGSIRPLHVTKDILVILQIFLEVQLPLL